MPITTPVVALVGFMRRRWIRLGIFGGIRVLVVRDGTIRLLGKRGRVDLDTTISAVTVKLTFTKVIRLSTRSDSMFVYGFPQAGNLNKELAAVAACEIEAIVAAGYTETEVVGPIHTGVPSSIPVKELTAGVAMSRAVIDALHQRGVQQG